MDNKKRQGFAIFILIFFSLLGLFMSSKLLTLEYNYLATKDAEIFQTCSLNNIFDCSTAAQSGYSQLFGFPNMILGIIFYTGMFVFFSLLLFKTRFSKLIYFLVWITTLGSFVFSGGLLYISLFKLFKICLYCLTSAFAAVAIFLTYSLYLIQSEERTFSPKATSLYKSFLKWNYKVPTIATLITLIYIGILAFSQVYYSRYFYETFSLESALLLPINAVKVVIQLIFN